MKRRNIFIIIILVVLLLITFVITFFNDHQYQNEIKKVKDEVLDYLKDKYHEEFTIENFNRVKNTYDAEKNGDYLTLDMQNSYLYTFEISSARLIKFDVFYVQYNDRSEYDELKDYNILKEGIYENYIYEYKTRDIKRQIRSKTLDIMHNSSSLDVAFDVLSLDETNILLERTLDSATTQELYHKYRQLDKTSSNLEFYELARQINTSGSLIINLDINDYITVKNVGDLQTQVKELVSYLRELGYDYYDINMHFKNYETARVTRYLDNGREEIYMIFDYEEYADVNRDEKLNVYIF